MTGLTDIHAHFLYGLDDGAGSRQAMETMLDAAYADGIARLFATPHVTPGIRSFDSEAYWKRLDEARSYCDEKGYAMTLYPGAEVMYTPMLQGYILDHRLQTLADSAYVLMEFVPDISLGELETALDMMERYGYTTVLAHIERYDCLFHGDSASKLKRGYDVRYQLNAHTVLNERGFLRSRRIRSWLRQELVDYIASDAHDVQRRPFQMGKAYDAVRRTYGQEYGERLVGMR